MRNACALPSGLTLYRCMALPPVRFLLAWIIPAWIALELVPTKLPHYALPLYPALALLAATVLADGAGYRPWARAVAVINTGIWALLTLLIAVLPGILAFFVALAFFTVIGMLISAVLRRGLGWVKFDEYVARSRGNAAPRPARTTASGDR